MRIIGIGSLATAAAVLAALFAFPAHSPADELKQAVEKAEKAKTVRMQIELDAGKDGKITAKNFIDDGKFRSEIEPAGLVVVVNGKADPKGVMWITPAKTYRTLDPEKDELVKQVTGNVKKALEQFKIPADDKVKGLADEYLDGRKTKVYEIKDVDLPEMKAKADLKMWIDPKTDMPVRSRVTAKIGEQTVTATATYLGYDEELDPKLFETKIPEGYKKMEEPKKDK